MTKENQYAAMKFAALATSKSQFRWHSEIAPAVQMLREQAEKISGFSLRSFGDFCAGIGGFRIALQQLGLKCVFSCEIDPAARATYLLNFGDLPFPDIRKIDPKKLPAMDIFCAGFPCQPWSQSGAGRAFEDARGTIIFSIIEIIKAIKPPMILLENVTGILSKRFKMELEEINAAIRDAGYSVEILNLDAANYGVPQSRPRVFFVCFRSDLKVAKVSPPPPIPSENTIASILEPDGPSTAKLDLPFRKDAVWALNEWEDRESAIVPGDRKPCQVAAIRDGSQADRIYSIAGLAPTHAACSGWACGGSTIIRIGKNRYRSFTYKECARQMGFPENYRYLATETGRVRQLGNSVVVPAVMAVMCEAMRAMAA